MQPHLLLNGFALNSDAQRAVNAAGGLRHHSQMRRAPSSAHGASSAMEQRQLHTCSNQNTLVPTQFQHRDRQTDLPGQDLSDYGYCYVQSIEFVGAFA